MPAAERTYGTLGKNEWPVWIGGAVMVLLDDDVDDAALVISPLDARRPLASAAEPKPLLGGTALPGCLDESSIDHDPVF
jgi:hypothetical protein